ncbi:hypothetical protein [Prosthecomicrobium sp. N25]|uniref:hypothetical protein n=1 Tax=Prosthecomicrobium sp. N25 TaxID=3129254 RepID=UPI0030772DBF
MMRLAEMLGLGLDEAWADEVLAALTPLLAQGEQVVRSVAELDAPIPAPVFRADG